MGHLTDREIDELMLGPFQIMGEKNKDIITDKEYERQQIIKNFKIKKIKRRDENVTWVCSDCKNVMEKIIIYLGYKRYKLGVRCNHCDYTGVIDKDEKF